MTAFGLKRGELHLRNAAWAKAKAYGESAGKGGLSQVHARRIMLNQCHLARLSLYIDAGKGEQFFRCV
jgi:hypothetical protein